MRCVATCSQPLQARLSLREEVVQEDVEEAIRLMDASKASLYEDEERTTYAFAMKHGFIHCMLYVDQL